MISIVGEMMRVVVVHAQNMAVLATLQRTYVNAMINVPILVIVVMTMKNFVQGVVMADHLEKFVMMVLIMMVILILIATILTAMMIQHVVEVDV